MRRADQDSLCPVMAGEVNLRVAVIATGAEAGLKIARTRDLTTETQEVSSPSEAIEGLEVPTAVAAMAGAVIDRSKKKWAKIVTLLCAEFYGRGLFYRVPVFFHAIPITYEKIIVFFSVLRQVKIKTVLSKLDELLFYKVCYRTVYLN